MQFVLLWTDLFVFLLIAALLGYGIHVAHHPHLLAPWRQVFRRPAAMASAVVLLAYAVIGLLDSIHFRVRLHDTPPGQPAQYAPGALSALDEVMVRTRIGWERTYSAPMATHAYAKETVERADGTTLRAFPRLIYGGAHLQDPTMRWRDIAQTLFRLGWMILLWDVCFCAAALLSINRHHGKTLWETWCALRDGQLGIAWKTLLFTICLLMTVTYLALGLSRWYHIFGTDKVGMDVLYLSLKGIRTGWIIGTLTTLVSLPFALGLGIAAGYFGRRTDDAIQYIYTTLSSIPGVLLIAASVLTLQAYMDRHATDFADMTERTDMRLLLLCLILGGTGWIGLCRLLRGETLKLREMEYVQAARAIGVSAPRILTRHILPNVMHLVLIAAVLDFSGMVLAEAVLSYVGVGVDPAMISWGNMINGARMEMAREPVVWWSLASAFFFMFGLVLAANLFADAVRDAFDPRLRGR